jgi:hypothetical protein
VPHKLNLKAYPQYNKKRKEGIGRKEREGGEKRGGQDGREGRREERNFDLVDS